MHVYVHLAYTVNDLRGVPGCTGGHYAPCIVGSCVVCKVRGLYRHHRTILPASVRLLPRHSELRHEWADEFNRDIALKSYATMSKPGRRTKAEALVSGRRVLQKEADKKDEAFMSVSVFSDVLDYHDVTQNSKTDLAHTIANAIKLLVGQVTNNAGGKSAFSAKYKKTETEQWMRFGYLDTKTDRKKTRYRCLTVHSLHQYFNDFCQ